MVTIALIPLVIAAIGLLMYLLLSNPKAQEIGRIMFFCGLLAFAFAVASETMSIRFG